MAIDNAIAPPSSGSKIAIGPVAAASDDITDLEGYTYDEVAEIMDIGEFGEQYEVVQYISLATRRVRKRKGTYDSGDVTIMMGHDLVNDTGQTELRNVRHSDSSYAFRITLNDAPEGGDPTTYYFVAKVMSFRGNIGGPNGTVQSQAQLAIDSDILVTEAAEAA